MEHPAFQNLSTYFLEKLAHSIDTKPGTLFDELILKFKDEEIRQSEYRKVGAPVPKQEGENNMKNER